MILASLAFNILIGFGVNLLLNLFTPKPETGKINDLSTPKSSYGQYIPEPLGNPKMGGNMIWALNRIERKSGGGKGVGGGKGGSSYSYFGSFAMLVCRGPVIGITRIWANDRILYDRLANGFGSPAVRNAPPLSPSAGDKYTVGSQPTGIWTGQNGLIAEFQDGRWYFYPASTTTKAASDKFAQYIRIYTGTKTQNPDPLIQADKGVGRTPAYRNRCYVVHDGMPLTDSPGGVFDFGGQFPRMVYEVCTKGSIDLNGFITVEEVLLSQCIDYFCDRVKLPANEIDTSAITGSIPGYVSTTQRSAKDNIADLGSLFFFDAVDSDKLRFLPPKRDVSKTIKLSDLATHNFGSDRPRDYNQTIDEPLSLPYEINLVYFSQERDKQEDVVRARKTTANIANVETVNVPIVLRRQVAQTAVDRGLHLAWIRRKRYQKLLLSQKHLDLQIGDRILLELANRTEDLVISKIDNGANNLRDIEAYPYTTITTDATYQSTASNNVAIPSAIKDEGSTVLYLLDINIRKDDDIDNGIYVAARGTTLKWRGANIFVSRDAGANYGAAVQIVGATTMGVVASALPNYTGSNPDTVNTITVVLESGSLVSPTGLFLLGDEILSASSAILTAVNTYTLSGLSRGQRGTEWAIATHTTNERFYLLSETERIKGELTDIGNARLYKAPTSMQSLGDLTATSFISNANSLKPYAPKSVSAYKPVGDIIINWIRRDRRDNSGTATTPKLSEFDERYQIDIFNGATVVRTIKATSPTATYTVAQQVTDFGSAQTAITIKVYQISETVGRGYAASYSSGTLGVTSPITYPVITSTTSSTANTAQITATNAQTTANNAVPQTRTITINGVTFDLSADRTWTVTGIAGANGTNGTNGLNADATRTSTTSNTIGATGSKTFAYSSSSNLAFVVGSRVRAINDISNYMEGIVTAISATSVTFTSDFAVGSGTFTSWVIAIAGERGATGSGGSFFTIEKNWVSDGDESGVFYFIGTSFGARPWQNPIYRGLTVTPSSVLNGRSVLGGERLAQRGANTNFPFHTGLSANPQVIIDLGIGISLILSRYTIRGRTEGNAQHPRSWTMSGSVDGFGYDILDTQSGNTSINLGTYGNFPVSSAKAYRFFKLILSVSSDSSNPTYLVFDNLELYGTLSN